MKSRAPTCQKITYADITPCRGELRGLLCDPNVLKGMYKRSVLHAAEMAGTSVQQSSIKWSRKCDNMAYWVVVYILRQANPIEFVQEFIGYSRLAEFYMLVQIFDKLDQAELETAYEKLNPAMAMNQAEIVEFRAVARTELPQMKQDLHEILDAIGTQSPGDFLANHHLEQTSSDIIAYTSLRCERSGRPLRDELPAVLDAISARVEALNSREDANTFDYEDLSPTHLHERNEKATLIRFIHRLLSFHSEESAKNPVIFSLTLECMTSQYSRRFVELLACHPIENKIMDAVINYICVSNAKDVDARFACDFFAALRKSRIIGLAHEVEHLICYYRNSTSDDSSFLLSLQRELFPIHRAM